MQPRRGLPFGTRGNGDFGRCLVVGRKILHSRGLGRYARFLGVANECTVIGVLAVAQRVRGQTSSGIFVNSVGSAKLCRVVNSGGGKR